MGGEERHRHRDGGCGRVGGGRKVVGAERGKER